MQGSMHYQDRKRRISQHPPGKATENPFSEPAVPIAAHNQQASSPFYPPQQRIGRVLVIRTDLLHLRTKTMTMKVPRQRLSAGLIRSLRHADHNNFRRETEKRHCRHDGMGGLRRGFPRDCDRSAFNWPDRGPCGNQQRPAAIQ